MSKFYCIYKMIGIIEIYTVRRNSACLVEKKSKTCSHNTRSVFTTWEFRHGKAVKKGLRSDSTVPIRVLTTLLAFSCYLTPVFLPCSECAVHRHRFTLRAPVLCRVPGESVVELQRCRHWSKDLLLYQQRIKYVNSGCHSPLGAWAKFLPRALW